MLLHEAAERRQLVTSNPRFDASATGSSQNFAERPEWAT
jgi:hypothetical protein